MSLLYTEVVSICLSTIAAISASSLAARLGMCHPWHQPPVPTTAIRARRPSSRGRLLISDRADGRRRGGAVRRRRADRERSGDSPGAVG
eukprot:4525434-Prymnesium_polylepis.3